MKKIVTVSGGTGGCDLLCGVRMDRIVSVKQVLKSNSGPDKS